MKALKALIRFAAVAAAVAAAVYALVLAAQAALEYRRDNQYVDREI